MTGRRPFLFVMKIIPQPSGEQLGLEPAPVWYQATLSGEPGISSPAVFAVRAFGIDGVEPALLAHLDEHTNGVRHQAPKLAIKDFKAGGEQVAHTAPTRGESLGIKAVKGCLGEGAILPVLPKIAHHWEATTRRGSEDVFFLASQVSGWTTETE